MHDWSDFYAGKILVELRKVATSDTKLVLVDSLMPFACRYPKSDAKNAVPGAVPQEAPEPLLANYGAANEMGYNGDLTVRNPLPLTETTTNFGVTDASPVQFA
jgi:hypothetical protein